MIFWYSEEAPPVSFKAFAILAHNSTILSQYPLLNQQHFIGRIPMAAMKSPTLKPNAGVMAKWVR